MAGGQGRCLPAVGQQVTAPDGGGMRPSAGRRVAAACNGSGRAGEVASGVVRCRCCWVEAGKDERSGFQAFSGSAVSTGSESLSSVSSSPSGISAFIAHALAGSRCGGVDGGSAFLQAIMGVRLVPVTLSAVTLHAMPSCTFRRPFSSQLPSAEIEHTFHEST